jgi:hypothetical protein
MAKLISIVGTLSGKLGGTVYSRNRWGSYVRQLVMPTQPQTPAQVNARGRIASIAAMWHELTPAQRLEWDTFAPSIVRVDPLGNPLNYNGYTAFMLVNTELLVCSEAPVNSPYEMWDGYQPDDITFTVTDDAMSLDNVVVRGASLAGTGTHYGLLWSCPWQSEGAYYPKTWRLIDVIPQSTSFPYDCSDAWEAKYGTITPSNNRRYFLGLSMVNVVPSPASPTKLYVSTRIVDTVISTITP